MGSITKTGGRYAERTLHGMDDSGRTETISLWIDWLAGGQWGVGALRGSGALVGRVLPGVVPGRHSTGAVGWDCGGMVDSSRTRSRISEDFRLVQRQLLRSAFGPGSEPGFSTLLMVTSARPGEGKSFTSVNLAGSIARQGDHHVLLVDADPKRHSVCYSHGLAESRGRLDLVDHPQPG